MGKEIDKYEMTYIIAKAVYMSKDNKLTGSQLASILNEAGFRTNQNKRYQIGERGCVTLKLNTHLENRI